MRVFRAAFPPHQESVFSPLMRPSFNPNVGFSVFNAQVLSHLPRIDNKGTAISSDLGSYNIVQCSFQPLSCNMSLSMSSISLSSLRSGGFDGTVLQYAVGPLLYAVLAILLAVLIPVWVTFFIIGRYCCCCFKREGCCCICTQCGGHDPSPAVCGVGTIMLGKLVPGSLFLNTKVPGYSPRSRCW